MKVCAVTPYSTHTSYSNERPNCSCSPSCLCVASLDYSLTSTRSFLGEKRKVRSTSFPQVVSVMNSWPTVKCAYFFMLFVHDWLNLLPLYCSTEQLCRFCILFLFVVHFVFNTECLIYHGLFIQSIHGFPMTQNHPAKKGVLCQWRWSEARVQAGISHREPNRSDSFVIFPTSKNLTMTHTHHHVKQNKVWLIDDILRTSSSNTQNTNQQTTKQKSVLRKVSGITVGTVQKNCKIKVFRFCFVL